MPLDWLVATSVMRGKEHLRDQYEKRKEMERQGRDIETERAVANMRGWMPAAYVDMAVVFIEKTNIKPTESEKSGWIKAFSEMQQKGINPKDIRDGINRMKDQGLTINSPFSVKANATSMMSIRKTEEARCLRND